jgi:hypothetical protein
MLYVLEGAPPGTLHQLIPWDTEILNSDSIELAHLLRTIEGIGQGLAIGHYSHQMDLSLAAMAMFSRMPIFL